MKQFDQAVEAIVFLTGKGKPVDLVLSRRAIHHDRFDPAEGMQPVRSVIAAIAAGAVSAECSMWVRDIADHVVDGACSGIESSCDTSSSLEIAGPHACAKSVRTGVRQLDCFQI